MRRRLFFFAAALLLTAAIASLGAISFERKVESFTPLGFDAVPVQGFWQVESVDDPATGLVEGDRILQIAGQLPRDRQQLGELLRSQPTSELLVGRGDALAAVTYQRPGLQLDLSYLLLCAIGVLYLLIGLYTALKDANRPAPLFFLWCLTSAALYMLSPPPLPADRADLMIGLVDQVARNLLPALTLHLFLVFPAGLMQLALLRAAVPFLYLPPAALLALNADLAFFGGRLLAGPPTESKLRLLANVELLLLVGFSLLAVLALVVRLARHGGWEERRQVQWVIAGMVAGYVPFFVLNVVPTVLGLHQPGWLSALAVLPLALVPLGFAYAILKYKLWDVGVILRDTVAYSLTALIGIFGFVLVNLAINRSLESDLTVLRNLLSFAAGLGIAAVLVPAKGAIAQSLERFQFGSRLAQRRALVRLGEELVYERDLDRLCGKLLRGLQDGLGTAPVNLYLSQGGAMVPVRLEDGIPSQLAMDAVDEKLWSRVMVPLSAVGLPLDSPTPEQRLFAAGYRYAFPLRVREQRIALALLGHKRDDERLSGEDVELARGLLNQAALAIENAQLLDEVHQRLQEVMRLEAHSKGIIESSPAGIAVLDEADRVVSANHAFAAVVGVERPAISGRTIAELLPIRPLPEVGAGMVEVSYCEANGRERYLQLSVAAHRTEEQDLRILVVQDVSERIAMEQALRERERLASLGMLAAGVAHEVNTPLTGISSYAQMLLADLPPGDPKREILQKMERQSFRASQIVNNLLEFARNRGDAIRTLDLRRVIDECADALAARAAEAGVTVDWTPPPERIEVDGDEGELAQVVNNLMANAIEAMAGQDPAVERRLELRLQHQGSRVCLQVVDTGPGIAPERLERIFQPFHSSKLGRGGSGLGLAITYNIVRRHGGEVRAENRSDRRGCIFTVSLPRHVPQVN